jgi:hypothetical protein
MQRGVLELALAELDAQETNSGKQRRRRIMKRFIALDYTASLPPLPDSNYATFFHA